MRVITLSAVALLIAAAAHPAAALPPKSMTDQAPKASAGSRTSMPAAPAVDVHSYANPTQIRVRHVDLDLTTIFERKVIKGTAVLQVERRSGSTAPLVLDSRALNVTKVSVSKNGSTFKPAHFSMGATDKILGAPLTIDLPPGPVRKVRIEYESSPEASGVQWMGPAQTAGKKKPFMFTQSEAIHARSWIPLQDSPQVRVTYDAVVHVPAGLLAVMSAQNNPAATRAGEYRFTMKHAIPPYLIALAVGDLVFRSTGPRTGVYADPSVIDRAAKEFSDTERMVAATERLYGPYRWVRYDLLVLPPSFPFGGMENPMLTFATPTVIAGDKSLVSLVAHELAHSWSGNLVTNATWSDFWLNEGFTVYLERRIQEAVYGVARANMEAVLGRRDLDADLARLPDADEILHVDLTGRDPDEGFTQVPYEKGALFLFHLEKTFGRERFDRFLRGYFDHFSFQSIQTEDFLRYLKANLLDGSPELAAKVPVIQWVTAPGIPASAPGVESDAFATVEKLSTRWMWAEIPDTKILEQQWSTQEWLHFLSTLPKNLNVEQMAKMDKAFGFTKSGNAEIAHKWLLLAIQTGYEPAYPRLESYLTEIGRRKLIRPLYEELMKTPAGRERAKSIYRKARPGYHPIAIATLDPILGWK